MEKKERERRCEVPDDENSPEDENIDVDVEFSLEENTDHGGKKRKRSFEEVLATTADSLPPSWNHIRISHHKLRPEVYRVVDILVS